MEDPTIHGLTAAYALDALDADERRAFEEHLSGCPRCRDEIADLSRTAALLAHAAAPAEPPPGLRGRILAEARADRGATVIPLRRRPRMVYGVAAAATALAASVAIALGIHAASLSDDLDATESALEVLADPAARTVAMEGGEGRLVVSRSGQAVLVLRGLPAAPEGKTYEAWVIQDGQPQPAGLFDGDAERELVLLDRPVPDDVTVAVTLERAGGVEAPEGPVLMSASA
jgi:anti-sigma-K factor RskA